MKLQCFIAFALIIMTALSKAMPVTNAESGSKELAIYPLGDSITRGKDDIGYRGFLYDRLKSAGYQFHFVGSLANGPSTLPDRRHNGHNGWVIDQIAREIDGWLARFKPDAILLMIGSNDIEQNVDVAHMEQRYGNLLQRIMRGAPNAHLFVSEISLIRDPRFDRQAVSFNKKIKSLVEDLKSQGNAVTFVPMHDVLRLSEIDELDHPNPVGNQKVADRWMDYLENEL